MHCLDMHVQSPHESISLSTCKDLEDVRSTMLALDDIRVKEIGMDAEMSSIEECYALLSWCGLPVPKEEMEREDSLRYKFKNFQSQAVSPFGVSHAYTDFEIACLSFTE